MEYIFKGNRTIYLEIGNEKASITSTSAFFQQLALEKGMETSQALYLRFALEDLFNFIFSFLIIQEEDMMRIKIEASFEQDALCLVIHECGIPVLAEEIPDITIEDLFNKDFQRPMLLDQPGTVYDGFGSHLIKRMVNEFSISHPKKQNYYEIRIRQYFTKRDIHTSSILPVVTECPELTLSLDEIVCLDNNYTLKRLNTRKEAVQVMRGFIETYGYSLCKYNQITDVDDYLLQSYSKAFFPYVVEGRDNMVIHHCAFSQCFFNPRYIEYCQMFTRPDHRRKICSTKVIDTSHHLPFIRNYEGLYAYCISLHNWAQLGMLQNGYHVTGFHFSKLQIKLYSTHIDSPEFFCLVEMHRTIHPRHRDLYIPPKYQQIVQSIYAELQLPVVFKESSGRSDDLISSSQFIVEKDYDYCRSLILLHPKVGDWENIRREVAKVRVEGIHVLCISISADEPDCIELADRLEELNFIFTGISPINDLLVFHYFNGIDIHFDQIQLVHDFGRPLLESIETEYNRIFPL